MEKGGFVNMEEFRRRKREKKLKLVRKPAEVHKLPIIERTLRICGKCGEATRDDICPDCGKDLIMG